MTRICDECAASYDDAICSTICPHEPFLTAIEAERKTLALALLGCELYWAHLPDGPPVRIEAIARNGMVTLRGWAGEFSPHLFRVVS